MPTRLKNIISKPKLLIPTLVVAIGMILTVVVIAVRSGKPAQAAPRALDVEVVRVEQKDVPVYSEWIGTTEGIVNADIKAEVSGYLLRQDYKEGSFVKKGQLLFELDPRPFQAALDQANGLVAQFQGQLEQASSQVTQAEAQAAQANSQVLQAQAQHAQAQANQVKTQLDVNKYAPLAEQKAVTQQDLDNAVQGNNVAKAQVEAARAGVETARAQLRAANAQIGTAKAVINSAKGQIENAKAAVRTAQLNLGFTRIISPIDGIAGIAQAQVGNLITTTSLPLTTVSTVDPIKVYFTLNEQQYLSFTKRNLIEARRGGSVAQIELELILSDGSSYPEKGSFFFADRQVDPKTGAIRMAGLFPNPGNVLRPGQYGRVRAVTATKDEALLVPQRAVSELQGSYQVAVVGGDNKIEMRTVKVGERSGSLWVIEDGLKAGETVVVEGTQKIKPGAVVQPKPYTGSDKL
ncbi:MAG TPA: efflux RND transporter periplasmic adaptor subunit [Pyrinomonadaceae bacterium]|nr:efflux RND transporter periplasmic adaptor subunit [Pyrinomonadaceae bacterium]